MDEIAGALKRFFGFDAFRPHQREIVEAILAGRDVFAALPTGGGKSLCYQLPSCVGRGLTVVVSPLIALMHDQVEAARENGLAAACLNSTLEAEEARAVWRGVREGAVRLLYVSPERMASERFREVLAAQGVALFAVDEAHCISEWGHEFRPDYRELAALRREFPGTPIAAFTATATRRVQQDVIRLLGLSDPVAVRGDFDRREIFYRVRRKARVAEQIARFVGEHGEEPGIVYRATRKSVEETAEHLRGRGVAAVPYHAGLSDEDRHAHQAAFVRDEVQVVVATIAFGMGIDKSNVRWVVHGDLPRSLEAYYQETGRAGRDGERATACLFYGPQDTMTIRWHIDRMEVEAERERALRNLNEMLRYVDAGVCRRVQLLAHFDQEPERESAGCDVCAGEIRAVDRTEAAQKAMSAMVRTGERFGAHHVADVVAGIETERVLGFRHDRLPTFGVGADRDRGWWMALIQDLEAAGLVGRRDGPRSGLAVARRGRRVLSGEEAFYAAEREVAGTAGGRGRRPGGAGGRGRPPVGAEQPGVAGGRGGVGRQPVGTERQRGRPGGAGRQRVGAGGEGDGTGAGEGQRQPGGGGAAAIGGHGGLGGAGGGGRQPVGAGGAGTEGRQPGGRGEPSSAGPQGLLEEADPDPRSEALFQELRRVRLELARTRKLPPYMIFNDKTLREMVRGEPTSRDELLEIHGVGERKAERYGETFLSAIRAFEE